MRRLLFLLVLLALTTAGSCNSEKLFQSNFDATAINQPPAANQQVGTASVDGPAGSVIVVAAPPNAQPSGKWLQVSRPDGPQVASFQGKLKQQPGDGTYVFSTALFIPQNNGGVATIQFEPFNQPVTNPSGFLHLDFLSNNRVRIDDDNSTIFGQFPRDQVFLVQVTLTINSTNPSAHIILSGAGASGEANRAVLPPLRPQAQQFGAVRIWMGFPNTGVFQATNVVVSRKT
jgi:hypothetical protein